MTDIHKSSTDIDWKTGKPKYTDYVAAEAAEAAEAKVVFNNLSINPVEVTTHSTLKAPPSPIGDLSIYVLRNIDINNARFFTYQFAVPVKRSLVKSITVFGLKFKENVLMCDRIVVNGVTYVTDWFDEGVKVLRMKPDVTVGGKKTTRTTKTSCTSTGRKVSFTKDGKKITRVVHENQRGTKVVKYKDAWILLSKLKI